MIIPAIDLIDGRVVRLYQGDYEQKTQYELDPVDVVHDYADQGATWLHIVDLTGAKDTSKRQLSLIKSMVDTKRMQFQAGGGIRVTITRNGRKPRSDWFFGGKTARACEVLGRKIRPRAHCIGLDINISDSGEKLIATHGWQENSGVALEGLLEDFATVGAKHVLCTDISRDGTLQGANAQLYRNGSRFPR